MDPADEDLRTKQMNVVRMYLACFEPEERLEMFSAYCTYCGWPRPENGCKCMKDE